MLVFKMNQNKFQRALVIIPFQLLAAVQPNFLSLFSNEAALVDNTRIHNTAKSFTRFLLCVFTHSSRRVHASCANGWPDILGKVIVKYRAHVLQTGVQPGGSGCQSLSICRLIMESGG